MKTTIYSDDWRLPAARLADFYRRQGRTALAWDPRWLEVLESAFGDRPYLIEAVDEEGVAVGWLPLSFVSSWIFGRFLVSLPYLNVGGMATESPEAAAVLIDQACELADRLNVKFLELRGEREWAHEKLTFTRTEKFHLRLALPSSEDALWKSIGCKARNQIRKGEKAGLSVRWGTDESIIRDFYEIFAVNMRDLGTPVYSRGLFENMAKTFNSQPVGEKAVPSVEFAVVYASSGEPAAAAVLTFGHSDGVIGMNGLELNGNSETVTETSDSILDKKRELSERNEGPAFQTRSALCGPWVEVPSASCKRKYNRDCANMFLYWELLRRSIERGQTVFDFGRSTLDSPTYRFKTQWGALPFPSYWQYYLRGADPNCMRPDQGGYGLAVRVWRLLPVWLTRLIGPSIVRGIP